MNDVYYSMFDKVTLSDSKKQEILQLSKESHYSHKRYSIRRVCLVPAACVVMLLIFVFGPTRVYADKVFLELLGLISVNKERVNIGSDEWLQIKMPDDIQTMNYDGTQYQYKTYDTLSELEKDLDIHVLDFNESYTLDGQVNFQVMDEEAGSINMLLNGENAELPLRYTMYFSTKKGVSTGQLTFEDVNGSYFRYDIKNDQVVINTGVNYDVVETYKSPGLDTTVLIVADKLSRNINDEVRTDVGYLAVFVYDHVEYQLYFESGVEEIKSVIEQMK